MMLGPPPTAGGGPGFDRGASLLGPGGAADPLPGAGCGAWRARDGHATGGEAGRGGRKSDRAVARARQAARRRTFPLINSQIIAAADTGDLDLLLSTVEAYLEQMNLVNYSTALHRLAKMAAADAEVLAEIRKHEVLPTLLASLRQILQVAGTGGAPPQCQALSNIAWSFATMQIFDELSMRRIAELTSMYLHHFKPFELSSLLWGFAKLGEADLAAKDCGAQLFEVAGAHVLAHVETYTFRCLVMLTWAFCTVGHRDAAFFRGLAAPLSTMLHTASGRDLATIALSFGTACVRQDKLFSDIAQRSLPKFNDFRAQDIVDILRSFARHGFFHRGFLEAAAAAAQRLDFSAAQLHSFICSAAYLRPRHHATRTAVIALLPKCIATATAFSDDEVSGLALAVAACFYFAGPEERAEATPAVVAEFFSSALDVLQGRTSRVSDGAVATVAASFAAACAHAPCGAGAVGALSQQAIARASTANIESLCILLRTFPSLPRGGEAKGATCEAVRVLAAEAARRLEQGEVEDRDVCLVHRVSAAFAPSALEAGDAPGPASADALSARCRAIEAAAAAGTIPALPVDLQLCSPPSFSSSRRGHAVAFGDAAPGASMLVGNELGRGAAAASAASGASGLAESAAGDARGHGAFGRLKGMKYPMASGPLPPGIVVKNTFVHVEEKCPPGAAFEGGEDGEQGNAGSETTGSLPPPLDIIPPDVSPDKLVAFRTDYQRFRSGCAVGARGELSSSVV